MATGVGLFSGGLDSILAVRVLQEQNVDLIAVAFETPFFGSEGAVMAARDLGVPLRVVDITEPHLDILRNPKYGYGKNLNPCIDCHALMFRLAGALMEREGADFLFSGEVLGQRPMSQNRRALEIVARESGYRELILRPLSARLLPPTKPEREGWVDRSKLLSIRGRSRKPQMQLAAKHGVVEYPDPAGGCKLTDPGFSARMRDLLDYCPNPELRDIELLKVGRHLRLDEDTRIVVGRNQEENEAIEALIRTEDLVLEAIGVPGPVCLVKGEPREERIQVGAAICARYSDAQEGQEVVIGVTWGESKREVTVRPLAPEKCNQIMVGA